MTAVRPVFVEADVVYDVCFVMNVNSRGWILEKICKEIERSADWLCCYLYSERNDILSGSLPRARNYFFAHFALCHFVLKRYPEAQAANSYVWYTHPDLGKGVTWEDIKALTDQCQTVFTPCSINKNALIALGASGENVRVPIGGAAPSMFPSKGSRTGRGAIGFVGAYYPRKQPEKMMGIALAMPEQQIVLVGPSGAEVTNAGLLWENWPDFGKFCSLPNVTYVEASYEEFPRWYRSFDVYCSTSLLEGGPIPAIEAMMSNVVPVISDTGFARDIIEHGKDGFIFAVDAPVETIVEMIQAALKMTEIDIAVKAADWSWNDFGKFISSDIRGVVNDNRRIMLADAGNAVRYLYRGFHASEERGAWMRGGEADIIIPTDLPSVQRIKLFAWASADFDDKPLRLWITVNGLKGQMYELGSKAMEIVIEGYHIAKDGQLCVTMTVDSPMRSALLPQFAIEDWSDLPNHRIRVAKFGWIELIP